ncbi:hypothetical protein Nepgr_021807 [Nepenthes gracilis]|uniref:Uncharacterized protein n=1 Tax=Nepenthes gracilis TaxID=150966 RepID=A0AAD3XXR5_NEPGR|nr:hypothetical protein Nepgr_021807 [Nepenthes gracilis]
MKGSISSFQSISSSRSFASRLQMLLPIATLALGTIRALIRSPLDFFQLLLYGFSLLALSSLYIVTWFSLELLILNFAIHGFINHPILPNPRLHPLCLRYGVGKVVTVSCALLMWIQSSAVECDAGIVQAWIPELWYDYGDNQCYTGCESFSNCNLLYITVCHLFLFSEVGHLKEGEHACPSKIQTTAAIGIKQTKVSNSPDSAWKMEEQLRMPHLNMNEDNSHSNQMLHNRVFLHELQPSHCQRPDDLTLNLRYLDSRLNEAGKQENRNKTTSPASNSCPLEKIELTDENDFPSLGEAVSDSCDFKNGFHDDKQQLNVDVHVTSKYSPIRTCMCQRKGEKALSEGRTSKDDGSNESVESCNSGALLNAGMKQTLNFEEPLVVENKRLKRQIEHHPGSTSFTRTNCSFVNWISSVRKGLPIHIEDKAHSLSLLLANQHCENENKGHSTCSRDQDCHFNGFGFQSFFKSIYRPNQKFLDQKMLHDYHQTSKGLNVAVFQLDYLTCCANRSSRNQTSDVVKDIGGFHNSLKIPLLVNRRQTLVNHDLGFNTEAPLVSLAHCKQRTDGVVECNNCHLGSSRVGENLGSPEYPSEGPSFKCSEAMASAFAKRLDAPKETLLSDLADETAQATAICFFCGVIGHD